MTAYWKNNTTGQELVSIDVKTDGVNTILTIVDQATGDEITEITTDDPAQIAALKTEVTTADHQAFLAS